MATFKFVLQGATGEDGMQAIKFRITHHRVVRYITTDMRVKPDELRDEVVYKREDRALFNARLSAFKKRMMDAYDKVKYPDLLTTDELIYAIRTHNVGMKKISDLVVEYYSAMGVNNTSTRNNYRVSIDKFIEYVGSDILIELITPNTINGFIAWLATKHASAGRIKTTGKSKKKYEKKPKKILSIATQRKDILAVKTILRFAEKMRYVVYDIDPFITARIPGNKVRNIDLPVEKIAELRDMDFDDEREGICRDVFMLTYYLCGINIGDMLRLDFRNEDVDYVRKKTENKKKCDQQIIYKICDDAWPIIDKYMNKETGRIEFGKFKTAKQLSGLCSRILPRIKERLGIRKQFVIYSARKSFAQHAFDLEIQSETIDYCLGHAPADSKMINSYVTVQKRHADKCIDKVMLNLRKAASNLHVS